MRIPDQIIDQIINRNDIVQLVSDYVGLEKKGKNYFGICPFHDEKTPSFSVSPEKQIFHCFSCGEGGNVVKFLEKIENISYMESITNLADRADIPLGEFIGDISSKSETKYFKLNKFVSDYYQFALLNTKQGVEARDYLNQRGITDDVIKQYKIGLAPDSVDSLYQAIKANGFQELLMIELGHVIKSGQKFYDKFKNRIMFPIDDEYGNIVGFSGRLYQKNGSQDAKYINTQETPVFKKSEVIYHLNDAKHAIKKAGQLLMYEGFMDVIASTRSGLDHAVATMGTALTSGHIKLLKRYTNHFVLCYDGDNAGIEATKRAVKLLLAENVVVSIVEFPEGLDPDDFVKKYTEEQFRDFVVNKQQSHKEYLYRLYYKNINFSQIQTVEVFKKNIFDLILTSSATEREIFLSKISQDIRVTLDTIKFDFGNYSKYKNQYKQKNYISESDGNSFNSVVKTIHRARPNKKKAEEAESSILFMMMHNRKYSNLLSNEVSINFSSEWYRMLSFDIQHYYCAYDTFDKEAFIVRHIKSKQSDKSSDYALFFNQFYERYELFPLERYEDQHFYQCLNVMKVEILAKHVESLKKKLETTIDDIERSVIGQKIIENVKLIEDAKSNNTNK